jgi:hypothetical protein
MKTHWAASRELEGGAEIGGGVRLRSWALPALVTFTPTLWEIAVGPFFVAWEKRGELPF